MVAISINAIVSLNAELPSSESSIGLEFIKTLEMLKNTPDILATFELLTNEQRQLLSDSITATLLAVSSDPENNPIYNLSEITGEIPLPLIINAKIASAVLEGKLDENPIYRMVLRDLVISSASVQISGNRVSKDSTFIDSSIFYSDQLIHRALTGFLNNNEYKLDKAKPVDVLFKRAFQFLCKSRL
jgi:hypothetical protein